tara:strand:+ start:370 stop:1041 length:672 start_codon:yes stop_codon:yes gene_type:complete
MNKLLENINGWTQSGPMGNDKQILPAILGVGAGLMGMYSANKDVTAPLDPSVIREQMQPVQDIIGRMDTGYKGMKQMGRDIMDPQSAMNQQRFQMMRQQSAQQQALQSLLARRQAAAMGQASGITAQQQRSGQRELSSNLLGQYQQAMLGQQDKGLGLLGQAENILGNMGNMQMGIQENIAQSMIAENQAIRDAEMAKNQAQSQMWSGIGGGLLSGWAQGLGK